MNDEIISNISFLIAIITGISAIIVACMAYRNWRELMRTAFEAKRLAALAIFRVEASRSSRIADSLLRSQLKQKF